MITAILSLLGSSAVGSLIGGVFAILNKKADLETKKLDLEHEVAKWTHDALLKDKDLEYARAEAAGKRDVAIVETEGAFDVARMQAISAAQAADRIDAAEIIAAGKLGWMFVTASVVNKLIRPVATVILSTSAIYINFLVMDKLQVSWNTVTPDKQYEIAMQAFGWITGQASAVLGYWFVSRGSSK